MIRVTAKKERNDWYGKCRFQKFYKTKHTIRGVAVNLVPKTGTQKLTESTYPIDSFTQVDLKWNTKKTNPFWQNKMSNGFWKWRLRITDSNKAEESDLGQKFSGLQTFNWQLPQKTAQLPNIAELPNINLE